MFLDFQIHAKLENRVGLQMSPNEQARGRISQGTNCHWDKQAKSQVTRICLHHGGECEYLFVHVHKNGYFVFFHTVCVDFTDWSCAVFNNSTHNKYNYSTKYNNCSPNHNVYTNSDNNHPTTSNNHYYSPKSATDRNRRDW